MVKTISFAVQLFENYFPKRFLVSRDRFERFITQRNFDSSWVSMEKIIADFAAAGVVDDDEWMVNEVIK